MVGIYEVIFGLMKLLVLGIQIFLVFIRPCMPTTTKHILEHKGEGITRMDTFNGNTDAPVDKNELLGFGNKPVPESRWTAWFASTLLSVQLILSLGYLTGNYGGFIDRIMSIGVKHFNSYFWILQPVFNLSSMSRFNEITRGFRLPKFDNSGFLASPIQQYPLELLIFLSSIIVHLLSNLITEKGSKSQGTIKNFRLGTSFAFMYQLLLASFVCIYKVGGILAFGDLDYFSGRLDSSITNPGNYTSPTNTSTASDPTNTGLSAFRAPTNSTSPNQNQ